MLGRRIHPGLLLFGALLAALALSIGLRGALAPPQGLARLLARRDSVARLLAQPPEPGQTIELDAYYSGAHAGRAPACAASCEADPHSVLSDQPFLPELSLLGERRPNPLPADGAWLVAVCPDGEPAQLPYHARFRGHLAAPSEQAGCPTAGRVFVVERVVRTYAEGPPAAAPAAEPGSWRLHHDAELGYSLPCPPGWYLEPVDDGTLLLHHGDWPDSPVVLRIHAGETHHDPYDPQALPPLLRGHDWRPFLQSAGCQGLDGYCFEHETAGERAVSVLFSGRGRTYELSLRYPLGLAAPQPALSAYSAVVAGFSLAAPLQPSPTPPVRQALGPGPFLSEEDALAAACGRLEQQIEGVLEARLVPEAEARRLAGRCSGFLGHRDGVWLLTLGTPLATRTGTLRLLLDGESGEELCREEVDPGVVPAPTATPFSGPPELPPEGARPSRWIQVDLSEQSLTAWEGDAPVRRILISSGTALHPTVTGSFRIYYKTRTMTMRGPDYHLPDVPSVMLFHEGYALHGAYWHVSFGTPISHGCVNMTLPDAAWLFDWAGPCLADGEWAVQATICNPGTLVVVHD